MSYSGLQRYGAYYDTSSNDENGYPPAPSPANTAPVPAGTEGYQTSARRIQYNSGTYNWPGQGQQNYGLVNGELQSYANNAWRGINGQQSQQPAYDFQRQQSSHGVSSSSASAGQHFYSSTGQPVTQGTQGLNSLAYASGLEAAGLQDGNHGVKNGKPDSVAYSVPPNTGGSQARTSQSYSNQRPSSTFSSHAHNQSSSSQQDLAASAAAALAGVVSRRQTNQKFSASIHHQSSTSTTSMGNAHSRDGYSTQASHGPTSPNSVSTNKTSRVNPQSTQPDRAPSSQYSKPQNRRYANNSSPDASTLHANNEKEAQDRVNHQRPTILQSKTQSPNSTAQNNNSIANLVTNAQTLPPPDTQQHSISSDAMPSYIDPSKVFNPYHKEYERKMREATEAEAEARRKASETPAEKPKTWSQLVVPSDSAAPHGSASSPSAPEQQQKVAKRNGRKSESAHPPPASAQTSSTSRSAPDVDADVDMAKEMKVMVERMREWKNKDPSMFQKLWDDMKKGGAAPTAPTESTPITSPHIAQASLSANRPTDTPPASSASKSAAARKPPGPGLPPQLNGYKVIVEENDEGLPDLGRFPAERRYRQSYTKKDTIVSSKPDEGPSTIPVDPSLTQHSAPGLQPVPHQLPARPSGGNTIWPEEKRKALAEAAVKALEAEPANCDKGITTQTIRDMLEQNPSYIDLCKLLEDRGLRFHRGQFARQLLSNVPDLATTQKATPDMPSRPLGADINSDSSRPALAQTIPTQPTTGVLQTRMNGSHPGFVKVEISPQTAKPVSQFLTQTPKGHAQQMFSTIKPGATSVAQATQARLGVPSPNVPPPVPGSKDALSRKRNFSELVDLTQLSDDEDYVMPSKQARVQESSPEPEVFKVDTDISGHGVVSAGQPSQGRSAFAQSVQFNPHGPQQAHASAPHPAQRPRAILARPINKSEALRKSYYDPKTVARDILIAAGRHPEERPLNAHLAGLLHRHIELDSDLGTFDWDAVDPGGPPMPRVQMVDIPAGPPKWKLGVQRRGPRSTREDEPIRERVDPPAKSTPAFKSLAQLSAQTKNLLQDSQRPANGVGPNPSRLRHSQLVDDTCQDGLSTTVTPQKRKASPTQSPLPSRTRSSLSASLREPHSFESERNMENPSGKRRGRPPGAKNKHPSLTAMKRAANTSPLISIPSRPRSPPPAHFDVYDCQWRKCNAKLHNLATLRKHISKVHRPSTEEAIKYGHTCWWKKCKTLQRNEDKTVTPKERFQSHADWMDHIEEEHLHTLGMEKGDGPSTAHIGKPELQPFDVKKYLYCPHDNSSDLVAGTFSYLDPQSIATDRAQYLADEHGRTVTAPATKATNNSYAPDALILAPVSNDAEERVPIKQYMRAHGNEKMDLKTSAAETLRAMEVKKERVGPGMDRGGCTLVNPERRATLLQNEGIARVVTDDD